MARHQPECAGWVSESGKSHRLAGWAQHLAEPGMMDSPQPCPALGRLQCTLCVPHCKLPAVSLVVPTCLDIFEGQTLACLSLHLLSLSQFGFPGKQLEEIGVFISAVLQIEQREKLSYNAGPVKASVNPTFWSWQRCSELRQWV